MGKKGFFKGAVILSAGGFLSKLLGAFYRIPLTNLIGGRGIGLYQLVYPVFCILLTLSASGVPAALSRLVAAEPKKDSFGTAMRLFLLIGACGTLLMAALSSVLSVAQGEPRLTRAYLALSPSVLLVSVISVFRGYFQGKNQMFPTACSEVTEQLVKITFGLFFAWKFQTDVYLAVACILFSVTLGEVATLFLLWRWYRKTPRTPALERLQNRKLLAYTLPVTATSVLFPLSQFLDSFLIVRYLSVYAENAVGLYGLYSGCAVTLINLPVSVCYGFAAASIPVVSVAPLGKQKRSSFQALFLTLSAAIPMALGIYLFPEQIARLVFRGLNESDLQVLGKLLKIMSLSAVLFAGVQTLAACLMGMGKPKISAYAVLVAVLVKIGVELFLLPNPDFSVFAAGISLNVCYFVAFFLDLLYIICKKTEAKHDNDSGTGGSGRRPDKTGGAGDSVGG